MRKLLLLPIKLEPKFYVGYYYLGHALKQSLSLKDAKMYYKKCVEINPHYIDGYIGLGLILLDLNELDESSNIFKKALHITNLVC